MAPPPAPALPSRPPAAHPHCPPSTPCSPCTAEPAPQERAHPAGGHDAPAAPVLPLDLVAQLQGAQQGALGGWNWWLLLEPVTCTCYQPHSPLAAEAGDPRASWAAAPPKARRALACAPAHVFHICAQGSKSQLSLLNIITELKKCCNHPFLFNTAEVGTARCILGWGDVVGRVET
jgi:hypothetical protein